MNTIQQIPASKVIVIGTDSQKEFILCYTLDKGYFIASSINTEELVLCNAYRAARMAEAFMAGQQMYFIGNDGNGTMVEIKTVRFMDVSLTVQMDNETMNPTPKIGRYRFINRDGNYMKFSENRGYHIDINSTAEIVSKNGQAEAESMLAHLKSRVGLYGLYEDLNCNTVDSNLMIYAVE